MDLFETKEEILMDEYFANIINKINDFNNTNLFSLNTKVNNRNFNIEYTIIFNQQIILLFEITLHSDRIAYTMWKDGKTHSIQFIRDNKKDAIIELDKYFENSKYFRHIYLVFNEK